METEVSINGNMLIPLSTTKVEMKMLAAVEPEMWYRNQKWSQNGNM